VNGTSDLRIRFVERPLWERSLTPQAQAIIDNSSLRRVTISDTGIEMLTAIVGRGMTPSLRRVVAESLRETMEGRIPFADQAADSILTEVYGEIIGPLMTCLERGGDLEIIRLERPDGADLLLVDKQAKRVILQECKGTFADYVRTKISPSSLDVCKQLRNQRNKGRQQLRWPEAGEIGSRRVRVRGMQSLGTCPIPCAERTVVVTAIPDGRLRRCAAQISAPIHEPCGENCAKRCLFSPDPALVCVLSSERDGDSRQIDDNTRNFLDRYKACERAIWGNAHGSVGDTFASVLSSVGQIDVPIISSPGGVSILTGLIERAIERNVFVDFRPVFEVSESLRQPALTQTIRDLHDLQGDVPRPRVTDVEVHELGRMLYSAEGESHEERLVGNWRYLAARPGSEGEGTPVESCIQRTPRGNLEMRLVPRQVSQQRSPDDLRWGISDILSAGRFPPESIYELFTDETASWQAREPGTKGGGESRTVLLGQTLHAGYPYWPFWFPFLDRGALREMRSCCPECHMLADWIERRLPSPPEPFLWRHWHRHHRHRIRFGVGGQGEYPLAFVTNDARGFMTLSPTFR
jgi:hypothetical protein